MRRVASITSQVSIRTRCGEYSRERHAFLSAKQAIWPSRQIRRRPLTSYRKWDAAQSLRAACDAIDGDGEKLLINMISTLASKYLQGYTPQQIEAPPPLIVNRTEVFDSWLAQLADLRARAKILVRIRRAERGHFGDVKLLDEGVSEMRIDYGPGYRVYFAREGRRVYLLLCGGNKSTQPVDIKHAKAMWEAIRKELS